MLQTLTGNDPKLSALGDDSNIDLVTKGGETKVGLLQRLHQWCIRS